MEALISSITAAGPSPKRPPHILFLVMSPITPQTRRLAIAALAAVLIGAVLAFLYVTRSGFVHDTVGPPAALAKLRPAPSPTPIPAVAVADATGRLHKLTGFRGRYVLLNLWATWCAPCIEEMPAMETLNQTFKDRKFQMLAISVDNDWKLVNGFYKDYNLTLPAFLDPGHQVANQYKVYKFPETFLIDGNGYVIKHTWVERWADPRVMSNIDSLIRQQEARQHTEQHQASAP